MNRFDVIIVGGGLAGLTAAIHLSGNGYKVAVFEKNTYPNHKVCGEYVSNEIVPYLESLGVSLTNYGAVPISGIQLSTVQGKTVEATLPLGGIGISRYAFDAILYEKALSHGTAFFFETVIDVVFEKNQFTVRSKTEHLSARLVIGAYGKRSNLDKKLNRNFIYQKSEWLGVKAHYRYDDFPDHLVALHNFKGGYGGLSKTETGAVNFCYLAHYASFKKEGNIAAFNERIVAQNPLLNQFLKDAEPLFKTPLSIAQISFHKKNAVENHMLMCGDTAGLIHPLCGNGMAMAIHSAKIASELICTYLKADFNRVALEKEYDVTWQRTFKKRLRTGRQLQTALLNKRLTHMGLSLVANSPKILKQLIKNTHGTPILC